MTTELARVLGRPVRVTQYELAAETPDTVAIHLTRDDVLSRKFNLPFWTIVNGNGYVLGQKLEWVHRDDISPVDAYISKPQEGVDRFERYLRLQHAIRQKSRQ